MVKDSNEEQSNNVNTVLPAVLLVGSKLYRTNYGEISEVIEIERVTKTQAIAKNGNYKFDINISNWGTAKKLGNTDRWSSSTFYVETKELKNKLIRQKNLNRLKNEDYSKLSDETLSKLLAVLNSR